MHKTTQREAFEEHFATHPVLAACGLRMMARHVIESNDPYGCHPGRIEEIIAEVSGLINDAAKLCGEDQHDRDLWKRVDNFRRIAEDKARRLEEVAP